MLAAIAGGVLEGSPSTAITSSPPLRSIWLYATPATIPRTGPKIGIQGIILPVVKAVQPVGG